jgi:hypothetical protein
VLIVASALLAWLAAEDQSRWQPWFYQYVLMLLALALAGAGRPEAALNTCRLIVAATYFWSGLAKLNPRFGVDVFPHLLEPLLGVGVAAQPFVPRLAPVAALFECGLGAALLFRRFRTPALFGALAMHAVILAAIGPLGSGFNVAVWPWNLAMMAFLPILFFGRDGDPGVRDIVWGRAFAFQKFVLVLFAVMPALSFFNLWDHYLSSALYSGNRTSGVIYLSDDVFDRLPEGIQDYVTEDGPNRSRLDIDQWSYGEMRVPAYPEARIYRNVARNICNYAAGGAGVELVVQGKMALVNGGRRSVYSCRDLQRRF